MLDFSQLQQLLAHVTRKDARSSFYRDHYEWHDDAPMHLTDMAMWHTLRPVTKEDLLALPLEKRSYIPLEELDHVRASSGTSGRGVLFSPRTHVRNMDYRLAYHDFKEPFMSFTIPLMPHWHEQFQKNHEVHPTVISHDPARPYESALIAKAAGVTGFSVFTFHVRDLGEGFKKIDYADKIRFIEIAGEKCSRALYEYIRDTFPNATLMQSYGCSEIEDVHMGMPCTTTKESPQALYHPKETHYTELIDEHGASVPITEGAEGELFISTYPGEPAAFPMLRFRIGDCARVASAACPHGSWSFTLIGRRTGDVTKIHGGALSAREVERVLNTMPEVVTDEFVLHYYTEKNAQDIPQPRIVLEVDRKDDTSFEDLAHTIAGRLRINPTRTYGEGVTAGVYLPMICKAFSRKQGKLKRIIVHE